MYYDKILIRTIQINLAINAASKKKTISIKVDHACVFKSLTNKSRCIPLYAFEPDKMKLYYKSFFIIKNKAVLRFNKNFFVVNLKSKKFQNKSI